MGGTVLWGYSIMEGTVIRHFKKKNGAWNVHLPLPRRSLTTTQLRNETPIRAVLNAHSDTALCVRPFSLCMATERNK
jgi:hypothetical protein